MAHADPCLLRAFYQIYKDDIRIGAIARIIVQPWISQSCKNLFIARYA